MKSWVTFPSFPPVIYRQRAQASSCRSLTVYLFGWGPDNTQAKVFALGVWGRDVSSRDPGAGAGGGDGVGEEGGGDSGPKLMG